MNPKLAVLLQVDLEANHVNVAVTGHLTETNQQALYPLINRARALVPGIRITVDLSGARHIDTAGLDLLSRAIEGADPDRPGGSRIRVVLPEPPPAPPSARQQGTPSRTLAGSSSLTASRTRRGSARRTAA
jgi:ABC-type transporter Mla MlaB component